MCVKRILRRSITLSFTTLVAAGSLAGQQRLAGIQCGLRPDNLADRIVPPVQPEDEWRVSNPFANELTSADIALPPGRWQHTGADYVRRDGVSEGQRVYAIASGVVVFSTQTNTNPVPTRGHLVVIRHLTAPGSSIRVPAWRGGEAQAYPAAAIGELYSYYLHLGSHGLPVQGQQLRAGEMIGRTYTEQERRQNRYVYVPHLHLEIWNECQTVERNGYDPAGREFAAFAGSPLLDPEAVIAANQPRGGVEARLDAFLAAIRNRDVAAFTEFFSRTRPWRHRILVLGPDSDEEVVNTVTFAQLQRSLQRRDDEYYGAFFGSGDGLAGTFEHAARSGTAWHAVAPGKFVPGDEPNPESAIYVRWRQEQGSWVVDEIAEVVH